MYDQENSAQMYDRSAEEHFRPLNPLCVQKIFMSESNYEHVWPVPSFQQTRGERKPLVGDLAEDFK